MYKDSGKSVYDFDMVQYAEMLQDIKDAISRIVSNNVHQIMGYSLYDINKDGSHELILLNNNYNIFAIFASVDKNVILVDTYGVGNHTGAIDNNGTIYKSGYSKGETWYEKVMTLTSSGELDGLKYGREDYNGYLDNPQEIEFYKTISGVRYNITEAELNELSSQYSHIFSNTVKVTKSAGLKFEYIMEFNPK